MSIVKLEKRLQREYPDMEKDLMVALAQAAYSFHQSLNNYNTTYLKGYRIHYRLSWDGEQFDFVGFDIYKRPKEPGMPQTFITTVRF